MGVPNCNAAKQNLHPVAVLRKVMTETSLIGKLNAVTSLSAIPIVLFTVRGNVAHASCETIAVTIK